MSVKNPCHMTAREYTVHLEGRVRVLEKQLRWSYERLERLEQLRLFEDTATATGDGMCRPADLE